MENPIAKKLEALVKLQAIDSKIDELEKVRGDLPAEVQDLEDEVIGYQTRIQKLQEEIQVLESDIVANKLKVSEAEKLIGKYDKQQQNVRNNREFEALAKEIELQNLEIQVCQKKMKEILLKVSRKEENIEETQKQRDERQKDLENKRKELEVIVAESEEDINKLLKEREKRQKAVDEKLYRSYARLRKNARNGLAVVMVMRDACGGCFNIVPPQRQADIRDKKKLIVCEHCGRILADVEDRPVEEEKVKKGRRSATAAAATATAAAPAAFTPAFMLRREDEMLD